MSTSFVKHAAPLINIGVQIQNTQWETPAALQEHILETLEAFVEASEEMGKSGGEIDDAKYGILSFLDELILKHGSFGYDWLEYRLMMKIFNDQMAGEVFFTKLDTFLVDDTKKDLLELYGILSLLGFQGKYQLEGLEGLQLKIKEVTSQLFPDAVDAIPDLSAFSSVPAGAMPKEKSGRSFILYAIGLVVLSGIVYMSLVALAQM